MAFQYLLATRETSVQRFITNPDVRFANNPGERKIRMAKAKHKVSGCFRAHSFAQAYCRIQAT
ncbi:MAG: transposase [Roseovarius sp.]|nr:transposase [Roseovarius sp.]MCY4292853.1 transposase [Roseovarius sp.]